MPVFRTVDSGASTMVQSYEHRQLLHRARRYIYIKGAVNVVIAFLFLLTFPLELKPKMVAIALTDALFLVPYWFLVQRYPTLATGLSVGITSLAISAGDWVGGYQTGASGILYGLLILGGHLVLIKPLSTYLISGLIIAIYVGTIALEVNGVIPINFPFTWSNLFRVVSLSVISMFGLTILTGVVTRLYRELLQRNQELLALNAVSAAASQSLDLDEVLQLALDKALEGMGMDLGGILLLDPSDDKLVLGAHRGGSPKSIRAFQGVTADEGLMPRMMECALAIDDLSEVTRDHQVMIEREGLQALASVPLKSMDVTLGVMVVSSYKPHTFTSQELELLGAIGNRVGVAIENARLYKAEQDRRRMAESLREMAGVIGSTLELSEVLQLTLEQLRKVLDYDTSSIMMLEGDRFRVIAVEGFADPEEVLQLSYTADEVDISWEAIRKKQALVIADATQDTRWTSEPQTADVRAWIGAPLIAKDEVIGLLTVDSHQVGKYSQDDAQLVMTFARQAALAIKNAQLFREMKERFEETIALYQTSLDIPERKRAEEMLRIKGHTIASSINAIAIAGFAGSLTYVNNSFLQMWGYDNESEVLGKPAVEFWQMEEKAWDVVEALRDGDSFTGELVAKRKDGSLFDVQLSASAVSDEAGRPICMMASFVDITERKRRTAELSTMLEATRAVSSTLDLEEVLALIAEQMVRAVGVDGCTLSRWDQEVDAVITWIEWRHQDLEWADEPGTAYALDDFPATRAVLETRQPVTVRVSDPNADPAEVAYLRKAQTASLLMLPLAVGNQVIGLVELDAEHERDFTAAEIRLCQALGDQATVAIENAQLYAETQKRLQEQTALREASAAISSSLDLQTVLSRIAEQMGRASDVTSAYICSFEPETMMSTVLAEYIGPQACPEERVSDLGATYVEGDVEVDVAFLETVRAGEHDISHIDDPNLSEFERAHMQQYGGQTILYIPLLVKGQFLGFAELWESQRRREFTPEEIALCQDMAQQAAIALENARLFEGERRQRQTAETLLKTSSAVASTLDLSQVLLTLAARLMDISGFHLCAISEWDREAKQTRTLVERTRAVWPPKGGEPYRLSDHPTTERVLRTGGPEVVRVGMDDPELIWMDEIGLTALLMLPLRGGEETIGLAEVGGPVAEAAFDQKGVLRCQQVLQEAASWLHSPLEANSGDALLALAGRLAEVGGGSWCALSAWHQAEGEVRTVAEHCEAIWPSGVGSAYWLGDYPSSVRALEEGTSTVARLSDPAIDREDREELVKWGARTLVVQPLSVKGEPIGLIELYDVAEERDVSEDELRLWRAVADQAAVAVQNARLYEQARREIAERKRVEEALQEAHEELERRVEERTVELSKANILLEREITVRRQTEEALERRAAQLAVVNEVARRAASILDMDQLLREVVAAIQQGFDYHNVALSLLDEATGELEVQAIAGAFTDLVSPDYRQAVGMGMAGWVTETGQSLLANDVSQEPRYILGFLGEPLTKAELCVPLKLAGKAIGVLDVQDIRLNAFDDTDLLAMETLADQIAVAIENARLFGETKRRFEELTFLNRVGQAVTSILDLKKILATVTEETARLLKTEACSILLLDEESSGLVFEAAYGPHSEKLEGLRLPLEQSIAGWVAREGQQCLVPDVREDSRFYVGIDEITGFVTKSVLAVPLKVRGKVIGLIEAVNKTKGYFSQADIALLSSIAQWAAIAIENARLYQQTDEKLQTKVRELAALYSVAEMVNRSDLDTVLQLALDSAIGVTGMDSGGIMLLDPSTDELFLKAHRTGSPQFIRAIDYVRADEGLMPRMLKTAVVIDDLSEVTKERHVAIEQEGIQSLVSVPLKAQESPLGVMVIASYSPRAFFPEELELLAAIANQVGVAVDRANLQAQELRAAILEERQHMARQMHDDIAQTLGYLGLQVDSVMGSASLVQNAEVQTELEGIRGAIEDTYERVRGSIMRLQEDIPDQFDFGTALQAIISEFEKQSRCKVESEVAGEQLLFLSPPVAFQAIYIIREALANVRKHSGADSVHLTLQCLEEGRVEVTIQDNGQGFDLDSDQQSGWGGFGLRFMRERAERVAGSLRVESEPGQGTRVVVSLPSG
jgi:PAS domain S-box-containing protein